MILYFCYGARLKKQNELMNLDESITACLKKIKNIHRWKLDDKITLIEMPLLKTVVQPRVGNMNCKVIIND